MRAGTVERTQSGILVLLCLAAWAIPGAGHLWLGRRSKGLIFLVAIPLMYVIGLALHGRIFPFDTSDPLVLLGALANLGMGLTYILASAFGFGMGDVRAVTDPYWITVLYAAGLL